MAEAVGAGIAKNNATLICGGLGGVMEAAAKGCKAESGQTIGILPGDKKEDANQYIDHVIVTAMSHARNAIIARSCDALIAVDGEYGTLSEIALALKMEKPVVTLRSKWNIEGAWVAASPEDAVEIAMRLILTR
ncbi:TIGR00725 family protein [Methanococcoides sp. FTZ1]|uniref:TIGR00725 family protein n=1 Tax=Methanococcoides sp. FTZ1 TaxID=3439061 RepID=UPI003F85FB9F